MVVAAARGDGGGWISDDGDCSVVERLAGREYSTVAVALKQDAHCSRAWDGNEEGWADRQSCRQAAKHA